MRSWGFLLPGALALAVCGCGGGDESGSGGAGFKQGNGGSGPGPTGAGAGAGPGTCTVFPADNWWNKDISGAAVDPKSDAYVASIGLDVGVHPDFGSVYGIPYVYVDGSVPKSSVTFDYADESDAGPYPIPASPPIEDGGDHHILMIHTGECVLYELYAAEQQADGSWHAGSGAIWDLKKNSTRPAGWTSADAAGLPIFPGLARYDEAVDQGEIKHALRFTVDTTQKAYVAPASHYASDQTGADLPPMGLRMRLRASVDLSGAPASAKAVLTALQKYGMFLADNGSNWYISGAPDMKWSDDDLGFIKSLHGSDFEAIETGPLTY